MKLKDGILLVLVLTGIGITIWFKISSPKIGCVRLTHVITEYEGMKEASGEYKKKMKGWENNLDTLKTQLNLAIIQFERDSAKWSESEKKEKKINLVKLQQNIQKYSEIINNKAQEEDQKMTQEVVDQVNTFVSEYGKKNGYSVIFGTLQTGNVMYAEDAFDITDEILKALNKNYKGD